MKKTTKKLWLLCMAILFAFAIKAQTTCSTSVTYTYPVTQTVSSYTNADYWFSVTTPGAGTYQLVVANGAGSGKIKSANVYTGSCGSLTLFATDSLLDSTQTSFYIELYDTTSTTYYIDLNNNPDLAITFSLSTSRQLYIGGDIGYDSTMSATLFALPLGPSGTQSYTWTPGGAHTQSITVFPSGSVTYTLDYSDALGTMSTTTVVSPLRPITFPRNCQLVKNGGFESVQNYASHVSNVSAYCGPSYPPYGPVGWVAPTCGSSDYFNTLYSSTTVGVPTNFLRPAPQRIVVMDTVAFMHITQLHLQTIVNIYRHLLPVH